MSLQVSVGADGQSRCAWCLSSEMYQKYHDHEWGRPITDTQGLFERLSLEALQSGLSWITVLKKREAFREAFHGFHIDTVASFGERELSDMLQNAALIRHRGKLEAIVHNARCVQQMEAAGQPLPKLLWSFAPKALASEPVLRSQSEESLAMSKALKAKGFRWVGSVTCYSLMQAVGMVCDHANECAVREEVKAQAKRVALRRF